MTDKPLYAGKAKSLYATDDPTRLLMRFRDDLTAFNAKKKASIAGKGRLANRINSILMRHLAAAGIETHFDRVVDDETCLVRSLDMIPLECIMRNDTAGGLSQRLGLEEGVKLDPPVFEFFYKNDALGDPFVNDSHVLTFRWASQHEIEEMRRLTAAVNTALHPLFLSIGLLLVDFKLEFGRFEGRIVLGDEFTPDTCRLWHAQTLEKLDKDRFRRDLGDVITGYQSIAERLEAVAGIGA